MNNQKVNNLLEQAKKRKKIIIAGASVVIVLLLLALLYRPIINFIYYNKIPKLYSESSFIKQSPEIIIYANNGKGSLGDISNSDSYEVSVGLQAIGGFKLGPFNDDVTIENLDVSGYSSYLVTDETFKIDALTLQKAYDSYLDDDISIQHVENGNMHIIKGGAMDSKRKLYQTNLFKALNNKVHDNTFYALGADKSYLYTFNENIRHAGQFASSLGFKYLSMDIFQSEGPLKKLKLSSTISEIFDIVSEKLYGFDGIFITLSQKNNHLTVDIYVEGSNLQASESAIRNICSKTKIVHLESEQLANYELKGFECDGSSSKGSTHITIIYDNYDRHLNVNQD